MEKWKIYFSIFMLEYIAAFTKVLTIYQIHHTWIHSLHHSPLFPFPHSWNILTGLIFFHFHTWVHNIYTTFILLHLFLISFTFQLMYTVFAPCLPATPFPHIFPQHSGSRQNLFYPPVKIENLDTFT
jgi:hypothetical protein